MLSSATNSVLGRYFAIICALKFQAPKPNYQTNFNDPNSKSQTKVAPERVLSSFIFSISGLWNGCRKTGMNILVIDI